MPLLQRGPASAWAHATHADEGCVLGYLLTVSDMTVTTVARSGQVAAPPRRTRRGSLPWMFWRIAPPREPARTFEPWLHPWRPAQISSAISECQSGTTKPAPTPPILWVPSGTFRRFHSDDANFGIPEQQREDIMSSEPDTWPPPDPWTVNLASGECLTIQQAAATACVSEKTVCEWRATSRSSYRQAGTESVGDGYSESNRPELPKSSNSGQSTSRRTHGIIDP